MQRMSRITPWGIHDPMGESAGGVGFYSSEGRPACHGSGQARADTARLPRTGMGIAEEYATKGK